MCFNDASNLATLLRKPVFSAAILASVGRRLVGRGAFSGDTTAVGDGEATVEDGETFLLESLRSFGGVSPAAVLALESISDIVESRFRYEFQRKDKQNYEGREREGRATTYHVDRDVKTFFIQNSIELKHGPT